MANVLDYLSWRGDLSFAASPFNTVDNLLFAMLSFVDLEGIVPADVADGPVSLAKCCEEVFRRHPDGQTYGAIIPNDTNDLFRRAAASVRFRDVYVTAYRNEIDLEAGKQFAAVTFILPLPEHPLYIAFRGTDDTIVGWREDFQLAFTCPTPSQEAAASYVTEIGRQFRGDIYMGGHSKGGNLAIYAAAFCDPALRPRIRKAYSNDGPGFTEDVLAKAEFAGMEDKLLTILPQSSIVGMLLEHNSPYEVIHSTQKMLLQHDPYSWQVLGPSFVRMKGLSAEGERNAAQLRVWVRSMSPEERMEFTNLFFRILEAGGAQTLTDITEDAFGSFTASLRTYRDLPPASKEHMLYFLRLLRDAGKEARRSAAKR